MNEEEAIELLKKLRFSSDEYYIVDGAYAENIDYLLIENAIETVLNLLEKKDIDIIETKEANRQLSIEKIR